MEKSISGIKETVGGLKDDLQERGSEMADAALEQSRRMRELAEYYARVHTWKTIGVVAVAAVAIGWILGNCRKH